jgi:hypothetical protein
MAGSRRGDRVGERWGDLEQEKKEAGSDVLNQTKKNDKIQADNVFGTLLRDL